MSRSGALRTVPADAEKCGPSTKRNLGEKRSAVEKRGDPLMVAILLAVSFGVFKAASSVGYLSAMGTADTNLGFVSQLPFMMINCLVKALVAFGIMALALKGRLKPGGLPAGVGYALLFLASAAGAATYLLPEGSPLVGTFSSVFLGVAKGAGTAAVSIFWLSWLVFLVPRSCVAVILASYLIQSALGMALSAIPSGLAAQLTMLALYAATYACARVLIARRAQLNPGATDPAEHTSRVTFSTDGGRSLASAWLCITVAQFVTGIANTAVFESSFSSIMAAVNVDACVVAATVILALLLAASHKMPDPEATFKVAMPILLAVFTLTALAADQFGLAYGYAMIGCYEAIAIAYTVFLVRFMQQGRYDPNCLLGLTTGVINIALLLGLAIGMVLNAVCDNHGVPIFTLLAFIAIYPFGIVLLFIQRNRARTEASQARQQALNETVAQAAADMGLGMVGAASVAGGGESSGETVTRTDVEDYHSTHVASFSAARGLTRRETEVCLHLTRGRTVKGISDALGISENTVWTHVRNVYAKCGVNTKQELIELFEQFEKDQG